MVQSTIKPPAIAEFQFIPIDNQKKPIVRAWQNTKTEYDFNLADGVGLVCGAISGNLEVIDIDLKYDLTGNLFERFKAEIHKADPTILPLMTVQKTRSGGYHFIYKCEVRQGNRKLASRFTVEEERKTENDKVRVLLETRGDGGYIAVVPTKGYEMVYGDLKNIQEITPAQRETIMAVACSFNEVVVEYQAPKPKQQVSGRTPFDDYNDREDAVALLQKHGWTVTHQRGAKTFVKRSGDSSAPFSGNFDRDRNWLTVFSTSTQFEPETAYLPSAVYTILEHNGDFNAAAKALYDAGYGDRMVKPSEEQKVVAKIAEDDSLSFLATDEDYAEYHAKLRNGTFQEFQGFGIVTLDKYLRLKDGDLYIVNGHDNVGKSTVIWYLLLLASMLYGWKWVVFSAENSVGGFMRKMIEFYWCKPIAEQTDQEYDHAKKFVKDHFAVILAGETLYSVREVMAMTNKVIEKKGEYKGLLIDPYNALKLEVPAGSKNSTHEQHYEVMTELKLWARNRKITTFVNAHAVTEALRKVDKDGFPIAPNKADTEGGGKSANKADQFVTLHRKTQHPDMWMYTEVHVRKVKETESGGKPTMHNQPVLLRMIANGAGFTEEDEMGRSRNPVLAFHAEKHGMDFDAGFSFPKSTFEVEPESKPEIDPFTGKSFQTELII